jgi:hypothetical protein
MIYTVSDPKRTFIKGHFFIRNINMEGNAVCLKCGEFKKNVKNRCKKCKFAPISEDDIAKSFILSKSFEVNGLTIGRDKKELKEISTYIQSGNQYNFDEKEINITKVQFQEFIKTEPSKIFLDVFRWLAPPIIILAIIYWLI